MTLNLLPANSNFRTLPSPLAFILSWDKDLRTDKQFWSSLPHPLLHPKRPVDSPLLIFLLVFLSFSVSSWHSGDSRMTSVLQSFLKKISLDCIDISGSSSLIPPIEAETFHFILWLLWKQEHEVAVLVVGLHPTLFPSCPLSRQLSGIWTIGDVLHRLWS